MRPIKNEVLCLGVFKHQAESDKEAEKEGISLLQSLNVFIERFGLCSHSFRRIASNMAWLREGKNCAMSKATTLVFFPMVFVLVRNKGYYSILWQISQAGVVQRLATLQHRQTQGEALQLLLELEKHLLPTQTQVALSI